MKSLFSILSLLVYAATPGEPIGLQDLLQKIATRQGFEAKFSNQPIATLTKPEGTENFTLSLLPEEAFKLVPVDGKKVNVYVKDSSKLIDQKIFLGTGIVRPQTITYVYRYDVEKTIVVGGQAKAMCTINVNFLIDSKSTEDKLFTADDAKFFSSPEYNLSFEYDRTVLEPVYKDNAVLFHNGHFIFKRKNNAYTSVGLKISDKKGNVIIQTQQADAPACNKIYDTAKWTAWSEWTTCEGPALHGISMRSRYCATPDIACEGEDTQTRLCDNVGTFGWATEKAVNDYNISALTDVTLGISSSKSRVYNKTALAHDINVFKSTGDMSPTLQALVKGLSPELSLNDKLDTLLSE